MTCHSSANRRPPRLTLFQQALVRPALLCLQLGASMYVGDLLRQYMWPLMMISLSVVAFVTIHAGKRELAYCPQPQESKWR